jgi:hypothetical protein
MRVLRITLGAAWVVAAIACVSAWLFMAVGIAVMFYDGYENPADSYTGQDADKGGAWIGLALLTIFLAFIVAAFVLPMIRLRHRR